MKIGDFSGDFSDEVAARSAGARRVLGLAGQDVHGDEWVTRLSREHNARRASQADREAAAALLGVSFDVPRGLMFRSWDVAGSTGNVWHVEEREDTKHGGVYVYCPCPAWKFNGLVCKHTERVAGSYE